MLETLNHPICVAVTGVAGKMGHAVLKAVLDKPDVFSLSAAVHRANSPHLGLDAGELVGLKPCGVLVEPNIGSQEIDVLVDFSLPDPSIEYAKECEARVIPMVIGTTGFTTAQRASLEEYAQSTPILLSANMSIGVNLCFYLLDQITQVMGRDSDIEITETHHRHKIDAPSGTAIRMGEVIAQALESDLNQIAVYDRSTSKKPRSDTEIGFTSLRAGNVLGDHTVLFANDAERLELTHKASSRQTFAGGALRAAHWLVNQPAGLYDMQDVLNLRN